MMNFSNVLPIMWILTQGAPFIVVHFRTDDFEDAITWRSPAPPIAWLTYTDVKLLVKFCKEALKSKVWLLVIVSRGELCERKIEREPNVSDDSLPAHCEPQHKLTHQIIEQLESVVEYLALTRWLIPRDTPISRESKLMCLVNFDDLSDVPDDYRKCSRRRRLNLGESYLPQIDYLSIIDFGIETISSGLQEELRNFLNLSRVVIKHETRPVQESLDDMFRWLQRRDLDITVTDFTLSENRLAKIPFSSPMYMDITEFLSKKREHRTLGSFGIIRVFDTTTWICLGLMLMIFYVVLTVLKQPNAVIVVLAAQLSISTQIKPRQFGLIMFTSGLLVSCAFSSGLLSSLSTPQNSQISTMEDLKAVLALPETYVCMIDFSFIVGLIDSPGMSSVFQSFAHKKAQSKLVLTGMKDCFRKTLASENMISILASNDRSCYFNEIIVGHEPVYVSVTGLPMSPGYPLFERVNVFVGNFREMNVAVKQYQKNHFDERMREQKSFTEKQMLKPLTLHDFKMPLIALLGSWAVSWLVKLYQLIRWLLWYFNRES